MTMDTSLPQQLLDYEDSQLEPRDAVQRRALGLRPAHFKSEGNPHPDIRPCPPWCWAAQSDASGAHSVHSERPAEAHHDLGEALPVLASLYRAGKRWDCGDDDEPGGWCVQAATIESGLEQVGLDAAVIRVGLR